MSDATGPADSSSPSATPHGEAPVTGDAPAPVDAPPLAALPLLPVKNLVLYPLLHLPLTVGRPLSLSAVEAAALSEDKTLVVVAQRDPAVEEPALGDLFAVGTQAVIKKLERSEQAVQLIVQGVRRVRLDGLEQDKPFLKAKVVPLPDPTDTGAEVEALHRVVMEQVARIQSLVQPNAQPSLVQFLQQFEDPLNQVFLLASMLTLSLAKEQALLEVGSRQDALRLLHQYLIDEIKVLELRQEITSAAQTEMSREQREYLLRQQMQAIREELGEQSPEQAEVAELRRRLEEAALPERVVKDVDRELKRLERIPVHAPDYQLTRTYVELCLELPWSRSGVDRLELAHARQVLDEDHYDLREVKDRIIEHLAVLKLNPTAKAPILCFVGPPGVGKTSLGKSIARAIGRTFERISLGGLHDESELRGHRRTYIGAMPGRIIQAIRRCGVNNPVLMLDEVDKLGRGFHGDPAAALLEVLDPAQNHEFHDNYLDIAFDLSKVFFVTTANSLDGIPRPLLDRMELLRLAGYSAQEKEQIARTYLIPRQIAEVGLATQQLTITDAALRTAIDRYTREAGLRQLERVIGQLARKAAVQFAQDRTEPLTVDVADLAEMLGPERFFLEEARKSLPPGVATGLAWTESGGEVLYIETVLLPESKGLTLTGQLGDVMRESAQTAQSFAWSKAGELHIAGHALRESGVHVHVPAGAVPKDGPSAGVAMVTALVSLYTGKTVRSDTAMTGEITLTGLVLPVGGIKEKVLAAHRAGIKQLILPRDNRKDLKELPEEVERGLTFVFTTKIEEVLAAAIPDLARP